jgi:ribosome maturation factor RimP
MANLGGDASENGGGVRYNVPVRFEGPPPVDTTTWAYAHVFSCMEAAMTTADAELIELLAPVVARLGLELVDIELVGSGRSRVLRVRVDRDGGVDLAAITEATQEISPVLDRTDAVPGAYTLEVSSPGLERPLRRPEHYARAMGETLNVKLRGTDGAAKRARGVLVAADDEGFDLESETGRVHVAYPDVLSARTVFEWGDAPGPGAPRTPQKGGRR